MARGVCVWQAERRRQEAVAVAVGRGGTQGRRAGQGGCREEPRQQLTKGVLGEGGSVAACGVAWCVNEVPHCRWRCGVATARKGVPARRRTPLAVAAQRCSGGQPLQWR